MSDTQRYDVNGPITMRYDWAILTIGKRTITLHTVTMSREYANWLAGYENDIAIKLRRDTLFRAVPLPITGDISKPVCVEASQWL